jgi:uncharacterized Tic20 family protein
MTSTPPPPPPPPAGPSPYAGQEPLSPSDEKLWSILTHVGGILFGFLVPLVTYLVFKDRGPFVRTHTATALNFQLTLIIAYVASCILFLLLIGVFTLIAVWICSIVFGILAAIAANNGQYYRYPLSITFVR